MRVVVGLYNKDTVKHVSMLAKTVFVFMFGKIGRFHNFVGVHDHQISALMRHPNDWGSFLVAIMATV